VQQMGIEEVLTAPRCPWQNPFVERVIGSLRRECLDHVIVLNERSLQRHHEAQARRWTYALVLLEVYPVLSHPVISCTQPLQNGPRHGRASAGVGSRALKEYNGLRPKKSECPRFPQRGREGLVEKMAKDVQERTKKSTGLRDYCQAQRTSDERHRIATRDTRLRCGYR
jgi:hypothetical protein